MKLFDFLALPLPVVGSPTEMVELTFLMIQLNKLPYRSLQRASRAMYAYSRVSSEIITSFMMTDFLDVMA